MEIFLHLGYPKCFSTTLQRGFFSAHPQILYGGVGIKTNIDYINNDLNLIFESALIYFRNDFFENNFKKFKRDIENFTDYARHHSYKAAGFSSEHLLFNFTPQSIDYDIKLKRIRQLFGPEIKIILVLREQFSLIISLYKEYVRLGYPHTFHKFANWIYKFQDRNFYHELMYGNVVKRIHKYFDKNNIKILFFENYKDKNGFNDKRLIKDLSKILNISTFDIELSNHNPSMSLSELQNKKRINSEIKHDLGKTLLEGFENHRRNVFLNKFLNLNIPEAQVFEDVLKKREGLNLAKEISPEKIKGNIFFKMDQNIYKKMRAEFNKNNKILEEMLPIDVFGKWDACIDKFEKLHVHVLAEYAILAYSISP